VGFTLPKTNRKYVICELENNKNIAYAFLTFISFKLQLFCLWENSLSYPLDKIWEEAQGWHGYIGKEKDPIIYSESNPDSQVQSESV
jgi:hypothetical protein